MIPAVVVNAAIAGGIGLSVGWAFGYVQAWYRGRKAGNNPVPVKPIYPNRVLIVMFGTIGLIVALFVVPKDNIDAAVTAYFVLLGNTLSSMKDEPSGKGDTP